MRLPERILFVGAHCDDIELMAGGLLARACFAKLPRVGTLVFSDHAGVVDEDCARRVRDEFHANLVWLGDEMGGSIQDHSSLMLPACRGDFQSRRGEIYAALEAIREDYDVVVSHSPLDTNQDHRQVADEVIRVFKAHAGILSGEFPHNDVGDFMPRVYCRLEEKEAEAKVRLVERYESQRFGGRPYFDREVILGLARVRGSQIRESYAEAYATSGRLVVR